MGKLQGTGNPGESGRGGKGEKGKRENDGGGPEPPSDGKDSKLNFKGQSLGIDQADVRGNGQSNAL